MFAFILLLSRSLSFLFFGLHFSSIFKHVTTLLFFAYLQNVKNCIANLLHVEYLKPVERGQINLALHKDEHPKVCYILILLQLQGEIGSILLFCLIGLV